MKMTTKISGWWCFVYAPRFWISGPLAFVTAVLVMAGGAVWMPKGIAEVDNIVLPLVLFPVIWGGLFFYGYLTTQVLFSFVLMAALSLVQIFIILISIMGSGL